MQENICGFLRRKNTNVTMFYRGKTNSLIRKVYKLTNYAGKFPKAKHWETDDVGF